MAGLCEGGNEPPGSLKASKYLRVDCRADHTSPQDGVLALCQFQPSPTLSRLQRGGCRHPGSSGRLVLGSQSS
ncbi:hypothetical protein ANN_16569 [Periplaneta americana]|uniref:Uncharacterized protein n=1 Tax=Periplaneta americana TaxID=6978 RepID=A0ABQ8SRB4_PERAM|nr:hypothetical protein ANN_16569 [Periplaneta americana]